MLPKTDNLRHIATRIKTTVIGISESKLDRTVLDPDIHIGNYKNLYSKENGNVEVLLVTLEVTLVIN